MTEKSKPYFITLPNRGLIHIEGPDRNKFLQNLISNDMELLASQPTIYACLLTPQGKFLHDFFVIGGDGFLLLDCEGGERARDLYTRLNRYRLRSQIHISVEEHHDTYALMTEQTTASYQDPRHSEMGYRSFEKPDDSVEEKPFSVWDEYRIRLCIPDGSRDMKVEESTLLEFRIDALRGISFSKGCYVGQEVTARMKHRGLLKKLSYTVKSKNLTVPGEDILMEGKIIGEMRSSCGHVGLAVLKKEFAEMGINNFHILNK